MVRILTFSGLLCLAALVPCSTAFGLDLSIGDSGSIYLQDSGPGGTRGGPFKGTINSEVFYTFCTELSETVTLSGTYDYEVASNINQGPSYAPNPELTDFGAWLFLKWNDNSLGNQGTGTPSGTVPGSGSYDKRTNTSLQIALWEEVGYGGVDTLDDPIIGNGSIIGQGGVNGTYDSGTDTGTGEYGNYLLDRAAWWTEFDGSGFTNKFDTDELHVVVLNLTDSSGNRQDMLAINGEIPNLNTEVPEPASLAIWGLTMGGLGLVASRRRRRKSA